MAITVTPPTLFPLEVVPTGDARVHPIDNGKRASWRPVRALERAAQHLAGRRKVSCSGSCRAMSVSTGSPLKYRIPVEPYTTKARVTVECSLLGTAGTGNRLTVLVTSDTDGTGVSAILNEESSSTYFGRRVVTLEIAIGDGTASSLGDEVITITFTRSAGTGTISVTSVSIQPLAQTTISI